MEFQRHELVHFLRNPTRLKNLVKRAKNLANEANYGAVKNSLRDKGYGEIHFYGSRIMEMSRRLSDIDIFISVDRSYWHSTDPERNKALLAMVESKLKADVDWSVKYVVLDTKVPVIKAMFKNLKCDITMTNGSGVENTKLIRYMFSLQPEAFKLYHFVRVNIHFGNLAFRRYMVTILVMFYLQVKNLMPSIEDVQAGLAVKTIGDWQLQFDSSRTLSSFGIEKIHDFMPHVVGFFLFYQSFDFGNEVMSPYLGQPIKRSAYMNHPKLAEFRPLLSDLKLNLPMTVVDTVILNHNCAWDIGEKRLKKFIRFCDVALEVIREN